MAFILAADGRDENVVHQFQKYEAYLKSSKDLFPPSAYTLATSDWYFDHSDHRSPHDAWLITAKFAEDQAEDSGAVKSLSFHVKLLGAYNDGYIDLVYSNVYAYTLRLDDGGRGHQDWRYDELRLSERGRLIHEIEWSGVRASQTLDSDSANSRTVVSLKSGQFDGVGRRVPRCPQG